MKGIDHNQVQSENCNGAGHLVVRERQYRPEERLPIPIQADLIGLLYGSHQVGWLE